MVVSMEELKGLVALLFEQADRLDAEGLGVAAYFDVEIPTREVFRYDMLNYMLFVAYLDRQLPPEELGFIGELFDEPLTVQTARNIVEEQSLSDSYSKFIPTSFVALVASDSLQGAQLTEETSISCTLLYLYQLMGESILRLKSTQDASEVTRLQEFLSVIRRYVRSSLFSGPGTGEPVPPQPVVTLPPDYEINQATGEIRLRPRTPAASHSDSGASPPSLPPPIPRQSGGGCCLVLLVLGLLGFSCFVL